ADAMSPSSSAVSRSLAPRQPVRNPEKVHLRNGSPRSKYWAVSRPSWSTWRAGAGWSQAGRAVARGPPAPMMLVTMEGDSSAEWSRSRYIISHKNIGEIYCMSAIQISAAKHLNAAISKGRPGPRRRGPVFPDRYHAEIITSPTQARHALSYVMNNFRRHQEDLREPMSDWTIDWFSSAVMFPGWAEYGDEPFLWRGPATSDPLVVYQPRTWLMREGWKKAGSISCHEVPATRR